MNIIIIFSFIHFISCLSHNGSKIIKIGLSFGIDEYDKSAIDYANAIFLKSNELHSRSDLIDPDARIELIFRDNKLRKKDLISTNIDMIQNENIVGMIGSLYSRLTILSSLLTQTEDTLPICCGTSTNPTLSDKSQFPNFFRTITSDNQQAEAFYRYLIYNGWGHIAIIYSSDEYGTGLLDTFSSLISDDIFIDYRKSIDIGAKKEYIQKLIAELKDTDIKIFLYFGQASEFSLILEEAEVAGLYKSGFVWLASEANFFMDIANNQEGLLIFYPNECDDIGCPEFLGNWNKSRLSTGFLLANESSEEPSPGVLFLTSCFELMVMGFDRLLKSSENATVTDLAQGKLAKDIKIPDTFSFPKYLTSSGKVLFDGSTGDRVGSYGVYNAWSDLKFHQIAILESDGGLKEISQAVYPGGTSAKPKDAFDPADIEEQLRSTMSSLFGLAIALFVVGVVALIFAISLLFKFRTSPFIRNAGTLVTVSQLMGLFLGLVSVLIIPIRPSIFTCQLELWILPFSFSLYYGMQFSKSFRIYRIFKGGFGSTSSNRLVFLRGIMWSVPMLVITLVWNIKNPPIPILLKLSKNSYIWTCQSSIQDTAISVYISYGAIMLFCNLLIAFVCRRIPSVVNETQQILLSVYNVVVVMILGLPLVFIQSIGLSTNLIVKMILIFYVVIFNLAVNFIVKVYYANLLKKETIAGDSSASKASESHISPSIDGNLVEVSLKDCDTLFSEFQSKFLTCSPDRKSYVLFYDLEKSSLESKTSNPGSRALAWVFGNMKSLKVLLEDKNLRISFDEKTYVIAFKDHKKAELWSSFFQSMVVRFKQENKMLLRDKQADESLVSKDFEQGRGLSLNILK